MGKMVGYKSLCAQQSHRGHHSHHLDELGGGNMALGGLCGEKGSTLSEEEPRQRELSSGVPPM